MNANVKTDAIVPGEFMSSRVLTMKLAPTIAMNERAGSMRASGVDVIGLAVGEPDFDTPAHIIAAADAAAKRGFTRYTAPDGAPLIKDAVIQKFERDNGLCYNRNEVHAASGAKQVIYNAFAASLNQGDEVIIFTPAWVSYMDVVEFCGGKPVALNTRMENNFAPDIEEFRKALSPRTKWVLLNSPSNPTGAIYSKELMAEMAKVLQDFPKAMVMSDEIYEHLVFDGHRHIGFLDAAPHMREKTLVINGVSKAYAMTGWRIGFAGGPSWLIEAMAKIQSQTAGSSSSLSQAAAAAALTQDQTNIEDWRIVMQRRRDLAVSLLRRSSRLKIAIPQGAFYIFAEVSGCIGAVTPEGAVLCDDAAVAEYILASGHVATVPGVAFEASPYIRLSFALDDARVGEACSRIVKALDALSDKT